MTAREIAKEYEQFAQAATSDYCRLKRYEPMSEFPALTNQINFCATMQVFWKNIARLLLEEELDNHESDELSDMTDYYDEYGA